MTTNRQTAREIARRLQDHDRRIKDLARKPQLANSSIEAGALKEYDADGNLAAVIGEQFDGSHGAYPVTGPTPPQPTAPTVTAGLESLTVHWDGIFTDEFGAPDITVTPPMDFSRVEVHVSLDPEFDAVTADTLRGTIETPRGGDVVVSPLSPDPHYVRLVARSLAGKYGAASAVSSDTPVAPSSIVLDEVDAAQTTITNVAESLTLGHGGPTLGQAIDDAAASPVTDDRLEEGSLTKWPFQPGTVPSGALEPGSVGSNDIADFSIIVRKFKDDRHRIY